MKRLNPFSSSRLFFFFGLCFVFSASLLFLPACLMAPTSMLSPKQRGIGLCDSDSDCLFGERCYLRYCQAISTPAHQSLHLQLIPPASVSLKNQKSVIRQQFLRIDPQSLSPLASPLGDDQTIWMREAYNVSGAVTSSDRSTAIPSRLRFTDRDSIAGQALFWEIGTIPDSTQATADFECRLTFGTYDIEIFPQDRRLPPLRLQNIHVTQHRTLDILLPKPDFTDLKNDAFIKIQGILMSETPQGKKPVPSVEIEAISSEGRILSSMATTDPVTGAFLLRLQPSSANPQRMEETPAFLRVRQQLTPILRPDIYIPFAPTTQGPLHDLGLVVYGYAQGPSLLRGMIASSSQEGAQPCNGCRVQISGDFVLGKNAAGSIRASWQVDTLSSPTGHYQIPTLQGRFLLSVLPPSNSPWARAVYESSSVLNDTLDVALEAKQPISGRVCSKDDQGACDSSVDGAQIRAIWKRSPSPNLISSTSNLGSTSYQTEISQANGFYSISLDPGIYDLIFIPPNESGLARQIVSDVTVTRSQTAVDALLPKASFLIAVVLDPNGHPLPDTTVELYNIPSSEGGTSHLLGRATTNALGRFSIPYKTF